MAGMRHQPQGRLRLDTSHPLVLGLVAFWLPSGGGFVSAISGVSNGMLASGEIRGGPKGLAVQATGIGSVNIPHSTRWKPTVAITVLGEGRLPSSSGYFFGCEQKGGNAGWGMYCGNGRLNPYLRVGNGWAGVGGAPLGSAGQFGFSYDGSTFHSLTNGTRDASQGISGLITNSDYGLALNGANDAGDNGGHSPGNSQHYYIAIWNRALSTAELASFYANPWQIFLDDADHDDIGWAAKVYKLAAEVGSFAITGLVGVLRAARRLPAAAGSFVSSGSLASLITRRRLPAASVAFELTGPSANLIAMRRMPAAWGGFNVAGSPAALNAARRVRADLGTFTFTGMPGSIRATRRLPAASGAFALAGGSVVMAYTPITGPGLPTYKLSAAPGAFGMAGAEAAVRVERRLIAVAGSLLLTGAPAGIAVGRRLTAAAGGFALHGAAASLRAARILPAAIGSFELVGADVQLRYSAQIDYTRAPAGPGYAPQQHYNERRPVATSSPRPSAIQRNFR